LDLVKDCTLEWVEKDGSLWPKCGSNIWQRGTCTCCLTFPPQAPHQERSSCLIHLPRLKCRPVMSTSLTPIPTALVAPIIEAYVEGIRPAFPFILILTIFGTLLVPLLFLLLGLSTPYLRRRPIFILNVVSVSIGIISSALGTHIAVRLCCVGCRMSLRRGRYGTYCHHLQTSTSRKVNLNIV
jgi:hypothetical protein